MVDLVCYCLFCCAVGVMVVWLLIVLISLFFGCVLNWFWLRYCFKDAA